MNKRAIGGLHEREACLFLEQQGLSIIQTNYTKSTGEIDIIARDGDYLAFIEVKFRSGREFGGAWYAISDIKKKRIRMTAAAFLNEKGRCGCRYFRFDAVLINGSEISYIKNAWQ